MKLKANIFLLAIVPFWPRSRHNTTQSSYMASKEIELGHYVDLATTAIKPLHDEAGRNARDDAILRDRALAMLEKMDFGQDGYFFVYDMHGRSLMHSREPDLVGRDLWTLRDPAGSLTIQQLIAAAAQGDGYVRYVWHRPSTDKLAPRLGYVVPLPRWG
ncbi:Methyl-accepting chemotaxis protein 4 [Paraburkholderia sabiae]|nr:Methyl-accepting chemotaxis protein 4 [Paraburkholderia sabiae]